MQSEYYRNIVEKVAAGLRALKIEPDAFVFIPQDDWVWDESVILGKPVYHVDYPFQFYSSQLADPCPFIPIWKNECDS